MPISPENKALYPANWDDIRAARLEKAGNACEHCGILNGAPLNPRKGRRYPRGASYPKVVLTIAHLDHDPTHNTDDNLRALCQKCHNRHDSGHRSQSRAAHRRRRIAETQVAFELPQGNAAGGPPRAPEPGKGVGRPET